MTSGKIRYIFYYGYNQILDSCCFYHLKDEKKDKNNVKKAKILLHLCNKYYTILNKEYNVDYMTNELFRFIYR